MFIKNKITIYTVFLYFHFFKPGYSILSYEDIGLYFIRNEPYYVTYNISGIANGFIFRQWFISRKIIALVLFCRYISFTVCSYSVPPLIEANEIKCNSRCRQCPEDKFNAILIFRHKSIYIRNSVITRNKVYRSLQIRELFWFSCREIKFRTVLVNTYFLKIHTVRSSKSKCRTCIFLTPGILLRLRIQCCYSN